MNNTRGLGEICSYFLMLSLVAVGGANVVIPEMHHQLVEIRGWMSGSEFVSLVALSQAAPGPNVLIVGLLGWKVAGIPGALTATAAMCLPSSLIAYFFSGFWQRFQQAPWRAVVQGGLVPVTVGLVLASGFVLAREADSNWLAYGVTVLTAVLAWKTKLNPLWMLGGAAVAGVLGWI
jgi:chromate transporter